MTYQKIDFAETGILLVDKAEDWTSHDVVNFIRRRFKIRKVGHCGTLDPIATGLLVLVLGHATKLSSRLTGVDKVYSGTMRLGIETDTEDRAGEVIATADTSQVKESDILAAIEEFRGEIQQIPPMVSAIKKNGTPLYKLARKGKVVERDPRVVTIKKFDVKRIQLPDVDFEVTCSKGTYIRTLCADVGKRLNCGAHMFNLRRLASGPFRIEQAVDVEKIKDWDREKLLNALLGLPEILPQLT